MATYHCPECNQELKKGEYPGWVRWLIGPLFGQFLRALVCDAHGVIEIERLTPEEQAAVNTRRWIGIVGGIALNLIVLYVIIKWL